MTGHLEPKKRAQLLSLALEKLDWETYIELVDMVTRINTHNLVAELAGQPAVYAYYSGLQDKAKSEMEKAKSNLLQVDAECKKSAKGFISASGARPTDKAVEAQAMSYPEYWDADEALRTAQDRYNWMRSLTSSLSQRKDMLVQLSSNARAEIKLND